MTHDELRNRIDDFDCAGMIEEPAVKALRAVVELHKPLNVGCGCPPNKCPDLSCSSCKQDYPCPTIQAIEKTLNG